jgi:hypothetical protein
VTVYKGLCAGAVGGVFACALRSQNDTLIPVEDSRYFFDALGSLRSATRSTSDGAAVPKDVYVELEGAAVSACQC